MKKIILVLIIFINSCASYNSSIYYEYKPINFNSTIGKWIINKPILDRNINFAVENETLESYKKYLNKKIGKELVTISELNTELMPARERTKEELNLIHEQTKFDFLIDTSIDLLRNDLPLIDINTYLRRKKEIKLVITIYDLKIKNIVLKKEHIYTESFEGTDDIAFSKKLDKVIRKSIKSSIKGLTHKKIGIKTTDWYFVLATNSRIFSCTDILKNLTNIKPYLQY